MRNRLLLASTLLAASLICSPSVAGDSLDANGNASQISCKRGQYGSTETRGLIEPLRQKVLELVAACKTRVISTYCRGGVTPNHRRGLAADVQGDYSCVYAHLKGWPGGYSTDHARVAHVHISYSHRHEWGLRFAHGGHTHTMSARRHKTTHQQTAGVATNQFRDFTPN